MFNNSRVREIIEAKFYEFVTDMAHLKMDEVFDVENLTDEQFERYQNEMQDEVTQQVQKIIK